MKIYTKAGDEGKTSLYGGTKILKSNIRIASYGEVDELNSFIGLLISHLDDSKKGLLSDIQQQLFVIGSHLAAGNDHDYKLPEIKDEFVSNLEIAIDKMQEELEPLKHFILPGGSRKVSLCHVCRTISRRAERGIVRLAQDEQVEAIIIKYINRLSDYFFVLSRYLAKLDNVDEVKWIP